MVKRNFTGKETDTSPIIASKFVRERLNKQNIAGRLPENSRNSFVDLQSQKKLKQKKKFILVIAEMFNFD